MLHLTSKRPERRRGLKVSQIEEEGVSRASKSELAHAIMAINNLGLSHVDRKATVAEYSSRRFHLTRSAVY